MSFHKKMLWLFFLTLLFCLLNFTILSIYNDAHWDFEALMQMESLALGAFCFCMIGEKIFSKIQENAGHQLSSFLSGSMILMVMIYLLTPISQRYLRSLQHIYIAYRTLAVLFFGGYLPSLLQQLYQDWNENKDINIWLVIAIFWTTANACYILAHLTTAYQLFFILFTAVLLYLYFPAARKYVIALTFLITAVVLFIHRNYLLLRLESFINPGKNEGFYMLRTLLNHAALLGPINAPNQIESLRQFLTTYHLLPQLVLLYGGWLALAGYLTLPCLIIKWLLEEVPSKKPLITGICLYLVFKMALSMVSVLGVPAQTFTMPFCPMDSDIILIVVLLYLKSREKSENIPV